MKKIYKIAIILLLSQNLFAQRYNVPLNLPNYDNKPIHFGFLIGLNTLDFKLTPVSNVEDELFVIQSQSQKGFNLGVVSNMRLELLFDTNDKQQKQVRHKYMPGKNMVLQQLISF